MLLSGSCWVIYGNTFLKVLVSLLILNEAIISDLTAILPFYTPLLSSIHWFWNNLGYATWLLGTSYQQPGSAAWQLATGYEHPGYAAWPIATSYEHPGYAAWPLATNHG